MNEMRKKEVKKLAINITFIVFVCILSIKVLTYIAAFDRDAQELTQIVPAAGSQSFINYDHKLFIEAQKAGLPIIISVSADWCGACKVQKKAISEILPDPYFENVLFMRINYDKHKVGYRYFDKYYNVQELSALLAFKGDKFIAKTVGDTDHIEIVELFMKSID